jgi:hypothetical protein
VAASVLDGFNIADANTMGVGCGAKSLEPPGTFTVYE